MASAERLAAVERELETWKRELVDVSGRNPLFSYRDLRVGTLDLTPGESGVDCQALESLLAGDMVWMTALFPDENLLVDARKRLKSIHRKALEHSEEKGIDTLFVAAGLATWQVETGNSSPNAPVVLVPFATTPDGAGQRNFKIERSGEPHLNPVLEHVLRTEHGVSLDGDAVGFGGETRMSFSEIKGHLGRLEAGWSKCRGLRISPRLVAGNFRYTNMAMVNDLDSSRDAIAGNDLLACVAGSKEAREALAAGIHEPGPSLADSDPPASEFLILDADSSQHRAINRALAGESVVIWGPPGTGKSQTIANLIGALIAQGKRVLFVAEKRAAIDVVASRLKRVGLSDLVRDVHGGVKSKRAFAQSMAESIRTTKSVAEQDHSGLHRELSERRDELNAHKEALHERRAPWGVSLYDVQTGLIGTPESAQTSVRLTAAVGRSLDRETVDRLKSEIREWGQLEGPHIADRYPDWARLSAATQEQARAAYELVRELDDDFPDVRRQLSAAASQVGLACPATLADWSDLLALFSNIGRLLERFSPEMYGLDHALLVSALAPANGWKGPLAALLSRRCRDAKKTVQAVLRSPAGISAARALHAVEATVRQRQEWNRLGGDGDPRAPADTGMESIVADVGSLRERIARLHGLFTMRVHASEHLGWSGL